MIPKLAPVHFSSCMACSRIAFAMKSRNSNDRMRHWFSFKNALIGSLAVIGLATAPARADSFTGTLAASTDVFDHSFTLSSASLVTIQTYGFGGGTNAAGTVIAPGGFDPLIALFSGTATSATILTDGGGNPIVSADNLTLFSPGCPPAGLVTVGTVAGVCGDDTLTASLAAGTYTLLLTDANFVPIPVNPGSVSPFDLTDTTSDDYGSSTGNGAYNDLTGGIFQTCATDVDCNTDNGNFAVDIAAISATTAAVPEPASVVLLGSALAGLAYMRRRGLRREFVKTER
jgi:hypothetical protein